jgi:hypothetical protein
MNFVPLPQFLHGIGGVVLVLTQMHALPFTVLIFVGRLQIFFNLFLSLAKDMTYYIILYILAYISTSVLLTYELIIRYSIKTF